MCAFSTGCLLFSHLSSWKLANFVLSVFMFRLVFLSFDLFSGDLVTGLFAGFVNESLVAQLPSILFLLISVLFIAMDLIYPRERK